LPNRICAAKITGNDSDDTSKSGSDASTNTQTGILRKEGLGSKGRGHRNPFHGIPVFALYMAGGLLLPGRKRIVPYSIQWLKRLKPTLFREDLSTLLGLLARRQLRPIVAARMPLSQARQAHRLLSKGGVIGKIVLMPTASAASQRAA
jgi:NADPH2:quinone reductase